MCEPAHSIVQIDLERFTEEGIVSRDEVLAHLPQFTRISNFLHFSKPGYGHSQALRLTKTTARWVPSYADWDGLWWTGDLDRGFVSNISLLNEEARDCATKYHRNCCTANVKTFRRFMEECLLNSNPRNYINRLSVMLRMHKYEQMIRKLQKRFDGRTYKLLTLPRSSQLNTNKRLVVTTVAPFLRRVSNFNTKIVDRYEWSLS